MQAALRGDPHVGVLTCRGSAFGRVPAWDRLCLYISYDILDKLISVGACCYVYAACRRFTVRIYFLVPRVADSDEQTFAGGPAWYKSESHQCMSAVGRGWASNQRLFEG